MKDVTVYQATMSEDTLNYDWTAGDHNLQVTLQWPIVEQEQWDIVVQRLAEMASDDPLMSPTDIKHVYDYINYYLNVVPSSEADWEEWWNQQTELPASLYKKPFNTFLTVVPERVTLCKGLQIYREELLEALHYQARIVDETGFITVCDVIPGGWFRNQDNDWAIRFLADVERIEQDQLGIVTAEVETYAEPSN